MENKEKIEKGLAQFIKHFMEPWKKEAEARKRRKDLDEWIKKQKTCK